MNTRFDRISPAPAPKAKRKKPSPTPEPDERSIYEKVSEGAYTTSLPYVPFKIKDGDDPEKKEARRLYQEDSGRLHEQFKLDCFEHCGVSDNPRREDCFQKAWEHGHSSGFSDVLTAFEDLVDLIKETPEERAKIVLTEEQEYVVFAVLLAATSDNHAVQDQMKVKQWDLADALCNLLEERINARQPAPKKRKK